MDCDCSRLAYGALPMQPLECKTILGPFVRPLVMTDVVFDLDTHPNGDASKACGFVWNALPTLFSARVMGCYCERLPHVPPIVPGPLQPAAWADGLPSRALNPRDPTAQARRAGATEAFVVREVLATSYNSVGPGDLLIRSAGRVTALRAGDAVAISITGGRWMWSSEGAREQSERGPRGTNLVAARRSPDGRIVYWAMYRESALRAGGRARAGTRGG